MQILHLIPNLSGGGAERQLSYLAPELANRGHEVHVAYLHKGKAPAVLGQYEGANVVMHQIKAGSNYDPHILPQIYRLTRQVQPDVMQSWILHSDVCAAIVAKLSGTHWVIREPSWPVSQGKNSLKFRLRKMLVRWSSAIVANSFSGMDYWKQQYPSKLTCMIRNGFPVEDILQDRGFQLDLPPQWEQETHYVLFVGRLDPRKNVGALLIAMGYVPSDIKLILCGSGQLDAVYRGQIKSLCLEDRVILPGRAGKERVWSLMRKAGALALVSHHEGFPNVLVEAMFNRCPLIVSDIPPHREFLDETTACFVNKDNPKEISQGIMRTLDDPQGNTMQIDKAFQLARQFTIERMVDEYEAFYDQLLRK